MKTQLYNEAKQFCEQSHNLINEQNTTIKNYIDAVSNIMTSVGFIYLQGEDLLSTFAMYVEGMVQKEGRDINNKQIVAEWISIATKAFLQSCNTHGINSEYTYDELFIEVYVRYFENK